MLCIIAYFLLQLDIIIMGKVVRYFNNPLIKYVFKGFSMLTGVTY